MTLRIHTARISYGGPDRLDVTRKGGSIFGPSWGLLTWALSHPKDDEHFEIYRARYLAQMRQSYRDSRAAWDELLARDRAVLCCYCVNPARCHRTLLAELLVKAGEARGIAVSYEGEISQ
jgi:hypothetical protein